MVDQKVTSNGNVTVWLVPVSGIVDYKSPTATEINAGLNVTPAIAWDGTTIPAATESDSVDDRSLADRGNATSRGSAQFEGTLNFFYPKDLNENVTDYGKAFTFLRVPRVPMYAVVRVLQSGSDWNKAAEAGEYVSVFRFLTDGWTNDVAEDDAYKYAVSLLAQGEVAIYTQVKNGAPVTVSAPDGTNIDVGEAVALRAVLSGKDMTNAVTWHSDDPAVATVSPNGVVKGVSAGTAEITATHPAATGTSTEQMITVTAP